MTMTPIPEREVLELILQKHKADFARVYSDAGLIPDLLTWHQAHRPQVTREQLEMFFLNSTWRAIWHEDRSGTKTVRTVKKDFLDDLLALLTREPKEPSSPQPPLPAHPGYIASDILSPDFGVCKCCKKCPSCCQCATPRPAG